LREGEPALRYSGSTRTVDRLGRTFRVLLDLIADARPKSEAVAEFARETHATPQETALALEYLEREHAVPVSGMAPEIVSR